MLVPFDREGDDPGAFPTPTRWPNCTGSNSRHEPEHRADRGALEGYDPQALSAEGVGAFLAHLVSPVGATESVGVLDAPGPRAGQDLVSPLSVPPHDNSAMDGYAFAGAGAAAGALQLEVVGTALAGGPAGRGAPASA